MAKVNKINDLTLFDEEKPDVKESAIRALSTIIQNNDIAILEKAQDFQVMLNQNPPKSWLKSHPFLKVKIKGVQTPYQYVPVERCELLLNRLFFGQWSTTNFKWQQIFNEISGSIDLVYTDPITGRDITRTGAASIQIMQDSGAKVHQFNETKKANALETGFPKLKSECFKNACKTLGNIFGANISRDTDDLIYTPLINAQNREQIMNEIISE